MERRFVGSSCRHGHFAFVLASWEGVLLPRYMELAYRAYGVPRVAHLPTPLSLLSLVPPCYDIRGAQQ